MKNSILLILLILLVSCNHAVKESTVQKELTQIEYVNNKQENFPIIKTAAEWESQLTSLQYRILRKEGTERPFTSPLNKESREGTFVCAGCDTPLFKSENKFDSGTGWPSFDKEIKGNVGFNVDYKLRNKRTEEHCSTCGGHLGHVFNDGPRETTGKRHCINGAALKFVPKETN